jgi:hypothetical protein
MVSQYAIDLWKSIPKTGENQIDFDFLIDKPFILSIIPFHESVLIHRNKQGQTFQPAQHGTPFLVLVAEAAALILSDTSL